MQENKHYVKIFLCMYLSWKGYFLHSRSIPWVLTKRTAATAWKQLNGKCFALFISIHTNGCNVSYVVGNTV